MIPFLDLKANYQGIREEIREAIDAVFEKGWFVLGERGVKFEEAFAAYCGSSYGIGIGSGTDALHLALRACGIGHGDKVVTVPNTAVPTVSAISLSGATPLFVDVDPNTYTLDPERLKERLRKEFRKGVAGRIKAVMPVHLYGQPADMDAIMEVAGEYGIRVIEDACQAHGAEYAGKRVGSIGDLGCFSFYPSKNLGAYGDGGMVVTDDGELASKLKMLRNYGQSERYHHEIEGGNSRLDELQAAMLLVKLQHLDRWNEVRRGLAAIYNDGLKHDEVKEPFEAEYARHIYHLYVVRCRRRDELMEHLSKNGVGSLIHYPVPIHLQPAYSELGLREGNFPVAERCCREVLSLPLYPELTRSDIEQICEVVNSFS
ncbi:MAG: DegT/DnrJ/EryC1/StrS family aminotransferase [Thermodesulfobacteriota bacterium]